MAIHPTAIVDRKAEIHESVEVGPFCVIEANVRVGARCKLYQNVYLAGWTEIGQACTLHPGVVVGHAPQDMKYGGERSFCRVGDRTILREHVTIHRGTIPESETVVGTDGFLLAGAHVGHNCIVGDSVTLINNALLAGHVEVGDRATVGGGAAIHQFVRIGELAMIGGNASVTMDILPFMLVDRDGRISSPNGIGLRRAGLAPEEIAEIRQAHRALYRSGAPFRTAVNELVPQLRTPAGKRLAAFVQSESRRGFAGRARPGSRAPGAAE